MSAPTLDRVEEEVELDGTPDLAADATQDDFPVVSTALAAGFASAAAAWMVASLFRGWMSYGVALLGVVLGTGALVLSYRGRGRQGSQAMQLAVLPFSAVVGAILTASEAKGASSNLPNLVVDAVRAGGLRQPPVSFDPGWRFVLVVLFAMLTVGAGSVAISLGRAKLAVVVPLPLLMGAALLLTSGQDVLAVAVAVVFLVVGLTLASGVELRRSGQTGTAFETRRLLRGLGMGVALAAVLAVLGSASFLFPQPDRDNVLPPQRPPVSPPQADRVIMTYTATRAVPLRLGVIDVYDVTEGAWMLPPYDARRLVRLDPPAEVPEAPVPGPDQVPVRVSVRVVDARGKALPSVAGLQRVTDTAEKLEFDPRGKTLQTADRSVYPGLSYTLQSAGIPTGKQLHTAAVLPPAAAMAEFLVTPPEPIEVVKLRQAYASQAQKQGLEENAFDRLQFFRQALYNKVVAAGPGTPVDLPVTRFRELLAGGEATPYEITAAEALLARWAGVPARLGFGYFGGDKRADGQVEVRPVNGAAWLEVHFEKVGWLPILGVPPKAKPSTSQDRKNEVNALQSDELALIVYIPVEDQTDHLLYEYVRHYAPPVLGTLALVLLVVVSRPYVAKRWRRDRRRRWAQRGGPARQIAVAYAEFRDAARDLTIGDPSATPIEFLGFFVEDPEHEELAWLVTRGLWGDLTRDLRPEDAEAAVRLAASCRRRMVSAQPVINVVLAAVARTSLREPWSAQLPNPWRELSLRALWPRRVRLPRPRLRRRAAATAVAMGLIAGCGGAAPVGEGPRPQQALGDLVPGTVQGLVLKREPVAEAAYTTGGARALVTEGRVWTVREGDTIQGSVQQSLLVPKVDTRGLHAEDLQTAVTCTKEPARCSGHAAFLAVERSLGVGHFQRVYHEGLRGNVMDLPDQRIYLWFPRSHNVMMMLILRKKFGLERSDALFRELLSQPIDPSTGVKR